ncbi:MAG: 30S ribosome-binding factor RbfA [Bacillota bacterium]|nr:30S ribosome-binding factor RbfA [Bacillota bacterium]
MSQERAKRVAERIKEEMGEILARRSKDPRLQWASVTRVEVSSDLRYARIYVSPLPGGDGEALMAGLERAKGFIRSQLGKALELYMTPEIAFYLDDSIQHGLRISQILKEIREEESSGEKEEDPHP